MTPMGSRRIIEVWSLRYSPADRPSSTLAAPAKKRSWSMHGGSSSATVNPRGFPVSRDSTSTNSRERLSRASAIRSRAS
jgi:hypothetical protein